ncbi:MAG: hypothetical protein ACI4MM_03620, partial [Candidatus Ventricola sp.]
QAIDTIELSPDVRNHRGVSRRRRKQDAATDAKPARPADEPIVPAEELTEKETALPESSTPARDAMRQLEREEGRRRRSVEVPTDETLRVVPVDQRPEFIAQGKVDDSQTRIFGKLTEEVTQASAPKAEAPADVPEVSKVADLFKEAPAIDEQPDAKNEAQQTIRLSREQVEEIRQQQEPREDRYAGSGKKKNELKPMKKKSLFSGLGKKKKAEAEEDEFEEEIDDDFDDDDDFIE